jgi:hypothetical protein
MEKPPMPFQSICPNTNKPYQVPDGGAGKRVLCPHCQGVHVATPAAGTPAKVGPPPSSPPVTAPPPPPAAGPVFSQECPRCGGTYLLPARGLGKQVRCPLCQAIHVAGPAAAPTSAPPPPDPPPGKWGWLRQVSYALAGVGGVVAVALVAVATATALTLAHLRPSDSGGGLPPPDLIVDNPPPVEGKKNPGVEQPAPQEPAKGKEAAPVPTGKNDAAPVLVLQIHSLDKVIEDLKLVMEAANKGKAVDAMLQTLDVSFGGERFPGLDRKKPWGVYAQENDAGKPPGLVGLVPVSDESKFIVLLQSFSLLPKHDKGGLYTVRLPQVPQPFGFRFAHGYAYVALGDFTAVADANLLTPAQVFDPKESAVVFAAFHNGRRPKTLRAQSLTQFKEKTAELKRLIPAAAGSKNQLAFAEKGLDFLVECGADLIEGGDALSFRLSFNPKDRSASAELTLRGEKQSRLARTIAAVGRMQSLFRNLADGDPALSLLAHVQLPDELRQPLGAVAREATQTVLRGAGVAERLEAEPFLRAMESLFAAGELDLGVVMYGHGEGKPGTSVAGLKVPDGAQLDKVLRGLVKTLPAADQALWKMGAERMNGIDVHRWDVQKAFGDLTRRQHGDNPFYYAFRKDSVSAAAGANGKTALRKALTSRPAPAPPLELKLNVKRLIENNDLEGRESRARSSPTPSPAGYGCSWRAATSCECTAAWTSPSPVS